MVLPKHAESNLHQFLDANQGRAFCARPYLTASTRSLSVSRIESASISTSTSTSSAERERERLVRSIFDERKGPYGTKVGDGLLIVPQRLRNGPFASGAPPLLESTNSSVTSSWLSLPGAVAS